MSKYLIIISKKVKPVKRDYKLSVKKVGNLPRDFHACYLFCNTAGNYIKVCLLTVIIGSMEEDQLPLLI